MSSCTLCSLYSVVGTVKCINFMHCDYQGKGLVYGPFLGGCLCVELKFNTHSTLIFFLQIKASPKNDSTFYLGGESLHMSNINVVESSSLYTDWNRYLLYSLAQTLFWTYSTHHQ